MGNPTDCSAQTDSVTYYFHSTNDDEDGMDHYVKKAGDMLPDYPGGIRPWLEGLSSRVRLYRNFNKVKEELYTTRIFLFSFTLNENGLVRNLSIAPKSSPALDLLRKLLLPEND